MKNIKIVNCSAVILAGGKSSRFLMNKSKAKLFGKPLLSHVVDRIRPVVDEVLVVVVSEEQKRVIENISLDPIRLVIDEYSVRSPIVGALTGFKYALGKYSILLPNDTPFISIKVLSLLFQLVVGLEAVIPIWPNNYIEPLQAVYETEAAYKSALKAFDEKKYRVNNILMNLTKLLYVSTTVLEKFNFTLNTFINVNTPQDMKEAKNKLHKS